MISELQLMKVDLTTPVALLNKRTGTAIGKCGYLFIDGEILDVECKDVSHLPDEVVLELPNSKKDIELEEYFNRMFEEMMRG